MTADIALTHPLHLGAPAWSPNGQALLVEMRDSRYAPTQIARLVRSGATIWALADPAAPKVFGKQPVVIAQGVMPLQSPTTAIDFNGSDEYLKSLMFWAIYFETSNDRYISANGLSNSNTGSSTLVSFLLVPPYCVPGALPGDNAQSGEVFNPVGDYQPGDYYSYVRHCPYDHRYMMAQAMINAFINYERRGREPYEYLYENFSATFGTSSNSIWSLDPACVSNEFGDTYALALRSGNETAARWLDLYTHCIFTCNIPVASLSRIQSAYAITIFPQIEVAIQEFYVPRSFASFQGFEYTDDPTHGAFQVKDANLSGDVLTSCVGGCQRLDSGGNPVGNILTGFVRTPGTNLVFLTSASFITQHDIDAAYILHIQQLSQYQPAYGTVLQPVLVLDIDQFGEVVGYLWISKVYQRSQNLVHIPRALP